jgi:hypothetical protein
VVVETFEQLAIECARLRQMRVEEAASQGLPVQAPVRLVFPLGKEGALIVAKVLKPFTPLLVMAGAALLQMLVVHKVAKGIQAMKLAWTLLKAAFVTNPLGMTVIALVAIGAGLVYAYKHSKTFRDIVKEIGDKLHAAFDWVAEKIKGIVGWIDTLVTKMTGLRDRLAPDPGGARSMMSPARVSKRVAAMDAAGARGGTIDDQIRAGFAAGDRRTPYPRRGFDRGHLSRSLSLYGAAASMTPGRQVLTSTVRGWGIGANSDHLTGRAFDVAGSNLGRFARNVEALGGHAEFHGNGAGRHVHAVGDRATPRPRGSSAALVGAGMSVTIQQTFMLPITRDDAWAVEQAARRAINAAQREAAERN